LRITTKGNSGGPPTVKMFCESASSDAIDIDTYDDIGKAENWVELF